QRRSTLFALQTRSAIGHSTGFSPLWFKNFIFCLFVFLSKTNINCKIAHKITKKRHHDKRKQEQTTKTTKIVNKNKANTTTTTKLVFVSLSFLFFLSFWTFLSLNFGVFSILGFKFFVRFFTKNGML